MCFGFWKEWCGNNFVWRVLCTGLSATIFLPDARKGQDCKKDFRDNPSRLMGYLSNTLYAMKYRALLIFFACLMIGFSANAQHAPKRKRHTKQQTSYFNTPEDWYKKVEGKPFPLKETYTARDGKTINFSQLQHPTFVCLGFAACPPCRHELPIYIEATSTFPDVDFVYITYDSEETRTQELNEIGKKNFNPADNYYIIHMPQQEIDRYNLTLAYPTQYFIAKNGIVKYMHSGGDPDEPSADIKARIAKIISGE
jgi:cytochrome oxidase Cu insertion factor (SCO1/SenC/PrrC family)